MQGLYKHIRTGKLYFVEGLARDVLIPNKIKVVYKQLYTSKLTPGDIDLPQGSTWIREYDDFMSKFGSPIGSPLVRGRVKCALALRAHICAFALLTLSNDYYIFVKKEAERSRE